MQLVEFVKTVPDEPFEVFIQMPTLLYEPQDELRVIKMTDEPACQLQHDSVPRTFALPPIGDTHSGRTSIWGWPLHYAKRELIIPLAIGGHSIAREVFITKLRFRQGFEPSQRRNRIQIGKVLGGHPIGQCP